MAINDYYQSYMDSIMSKTAPAMKKQQEGMYDYLVQVGQRQGIPEAMRRAGEGVAPYAEASGKAASDAGVAATQLARRQDEFETQQQNWEKSFETQQDQWQKSFDAQQTQQNLANMLAVFGETGFTPELMDKLGYGGLSKRDMDRFSRDNPFGGSGYGGQGGRDIYGGTSGAWNNWGGKTGLIYG